VTSLGRSGLLMNSKVPEQMTTLIQCIWVTDMYNFWSWKINVEKEGTTFTLVFFASNHMK